MLFKCINIATTTTAILEQATEVSSSNAMEKYGLQKCLAFLEVEDMVVDALITDRHASIKAMMRECCPHIKHLFDAWHVVKGMLIYSA